MSLLDAVSFYRHYNCPAVQRGNDSVETTVVEEGQSQVVGLWVSHSMEVDHQS